MDFTLATYVVLDIPEPIAPEVRALRTRFDPVGAAFPIEITVAGSGGVGPLAEGQDAGHVFAKLSAVAASRGAFSSSFDRVGRFPGTDIFYLAPSDEAPFRRVHEAVTSCGVLFRPSPFPFTPHCTIRLTGAIPPEHAEELAVLDIPRGTFRINRLTVYQINPAKRSCLELFTAPLGS